MPFSVGVIETAQASHILRVAGFEAVNLFQRSAFEFWTHQSDLRSVVDGIEYLSSAVTYSESQQSAWMRQ